MPNFKREKFSAGNEAGHIETFDGMVKVSASGKFYVNLPPYLYHLVAGEHRKGRSTSAQADTYDGLKAIVQDAMDRYVRPTITRTNVIRYNIESHVSFAEMPDGEIVPSAVPEGSSWAKLDDRYGNHDAVHGSKGGYSLTIGAQAFTRITTSYGELFEDRYELFYGEGDHLSSKCPASLLNSWGSFNLPREPREMPYTDEAAMFFHNLMLGMAEMSRKVQAFAADDETLLTLIEQGYTPLLTE